jgi:hypothetical protein
MVMILVTSSYASAQPVLRLGAERDLRLTMQARKLLYDDPALAPLNLGVIVNDRVAVLWGPAPTAEAIVRAERTLRKMGELVEIRNKLFLDEPLEPARSPRNIEPPALKVPMDTRPMFGTPGVLTAQESADRPKQLVQILPPIAIGTAQPDEKPAESDALADAIRQLLKSKPSFRTVEFTVKERHVYLKAADGDADALHEAARAISRLPNVEGVILFDRSSPR